MFRVYRLSLIFRVMSASSTSPFRRPRCDGGWNSPSWSEKLLELQPDLAPRSALFALADSLAGLLDEMQSEGVTPECIRDLDVVDVSGHWQRGLQFVSLVERYFASEFQQGLDALSRQRLVAERLAEEWSEEPPAHPIIVAGSTGSRGATALFMRAVAQLPQGAVVLPCMDFDLPPSVWERLGDGAYHSGPSAVPVCPSLW